MSRRYSVVAAAAMAFAGWPGSAGLTAALEHPKLAPTRSVVVTYELSGSSRTDGATKLQVSYSNQPGRVRMDFFRSAESSKPFGSLIFDRPQNRVVTLLPAQRAYLERDAAGLANPGLLLGPDMHYVRQGTQQVAGLTCTDWQVSGGDQRGTACVTDDGVPLKATRGAPNSGEMDAITVEYTEPPAAAFSIPPGFRRLKSAPSPR